MQVILMVHVPKLGKMGDVVQVAPGYGRNYLIPQSKARLATKDAIRDFEARRSELEAQHAQLKQQAQTLAESISGLTVTVIRQAGENKHLYGSVTAKDVADAVSEHCTVARSAVALAHPIKELGVFKAYVTLHPEVVAPVLVSVAQTQEESVVQIKAFQEPAVATDAS